jgi:drug/metabolite transporter (DMT)-like permease
MKQSGIWFFALHMLLLIYAAGSVCSKLASGYPFGSAAFVTLYGGSILSLGIYALGWQQIIKRLPLTTAYANKAVTVVWGMVFGVGLFREQIRLQQIAGAAVIMIGVILFSTANAEEPG